MKIKFVSEGFGNGIRLVRYQLLSCNEWIIVDDEHQVLGEYENLFARATVRRVLDEILRKRTVSVPLPEDEAQPYFSRSFGDIKEE